MNKLKNSFALGISLGLASSFILLVAFDAVLYFIYKFKSEKPISLDVAFAICIMVSLLLARKFFRTKEQEKLGQGFLFSSFIWGAAYVYLFHSYHLKTLFFHF